MSPGVMNTPDFAISAKSLILEIVASTFISSRLS